MDIEIKKKDGYNSLTINITGRHKYTARNRKKEINYFVGNKLVKYGEEQVKNIVKMILNELGDKVLDMNAKDIKTYLSANLNKHLRSETIGAKLEKFAEEKQEDYKFDKLDYLDPNQAKSIIILGASGSGKTSILVKMLDKLKPKDYFKVIIFTESPNSAPLNDFKNRMKNNTFIFDTFTPKIVYFLKQINELSNNKYKFLIILDDVIELRSGILNKMMLVFRNSNISSVILSQYSKLLTPASRASAWYTIIRNLRSADWEHVIKMYGLRDENNPKKYPSVYARELNEKMKGYDKIMVLDNRKDEMSIKYY